MRIPLLPRQRQRHQRGNERVTAVGLHQAPQRIQTAALKAHIAGHHIAHTEEELKMIVSASTEAGVLEPEEEELIHRVFEFADLTANQVMVPRTELIGLQLTASREKIEEILHEHGFTRYPVYDGSLDNILGVVNVKDLLPLLQELFDFRFWSPVTIAPRRVPGRP